MATLPELLRMIEETKVALMALDERIEQRVAKVDELSNRFSALGVGGGPVQALAAAKNDLEETRQARSGVAKTLERARSFAELAVDHNKGAAGLAPAQVDDPSQWRVSPSGELIVRRNEPKSVQRSLKQMLTRRGDDVADALEETTKFASSAKSFTRNDKEPPELANTSTSSPPPEKPTIRQDQKIQGDAGSGVVAGFVAALVVVNSVNAVTDKVAQVRGWRGNESPE